MIDSTIKWALLFLLSLTLMSCQQNEVDLVSFNDLKQIDELNQLSLPDDAKILYSAESDRAGNNTFIRRIIFSKNRLDNNRYKTKTIYSNTAYESLRTPLKNIEIGLPSNSYSYSRWTNRNGEWRGIWVKTSNGFYLDLEQIITDDNL